MTAEGLLTAMIGGAFLQFLILRYYFSLKRKYMRELLRNLNKDGEVS